MSKIFNKTKTDDTDRSQSFVGNVFLLTISTILVKVLGLIYKIPMLSLLGTEGMGYYNTAYELFAFICVLATSGLPVALSLLIASQDTTNSYRIKRIYNTSLGIFITIGITGTILFLFFSKQISDLIGNSPARISIIAIAPSVFFVCISTAIRGYFQGHNIMEPTAISQLIEAAGKLILGFAFAGIAIYKGASIGLATAFSCVGLSLSMLLSSVYLKIRKTIFDKKKYYNKINKINECRSQTSSLLKIAFPITAGALVLSLLRVLDMSLLLKRLCDIGYSYSESNKIYGAYTTLALPIFGLVPALISPISMALIPRIGMALKNNDREDLLLTSNTSLRLTTIFAVPSALGICVFSKDILSLLFYGQTDAINIAFPMLSVLGISVIFSCLITVTNSLLQANGKTGLTFISLGIGALLKIITAYLLIGNNKFGPMGAPISTLICDLFITALNFIFLYKTDKELIDNKINCFLKPIFVSAISIGLSFLFNRANLVESRMSFFISIFIACAIYFPLLLLSNCVTKEDMKLLTFNNKFIKNKGR